MAFKTEIELEIWNYFYLTGTRNNLVMGRFDLRMVQFSWPWLFSCQLAATQLAEMALSEYRAGRLKWS